MYFENGIELPDSLDYAQTAYLRENLANASYFPSTIKFNSRLLWYNRRYLMQRAISVFDWTLPDSIERNYFLYVMYNRGFGFVFNTKKYGTIFNHGGLSGYDIYYQPAYAVVANPMLQNDYGEDPEYYAHMRIGEDCAVLRLTPDYGGIGDIIQYYAELLSTAASSLITNLFNTKYAYVFAAKNKAMAESLKKMYDKISGGEPAVVLDSKLYDDNGNLNMQAFDAAVKNVYIGDQLIEDIRAVMNDFDSCIGIPNANINKKERMITDEATANNFETKSLCYTWYDMLKKDLEVVNSKYPDFRIDVKFRREVENNGAGSTDKPSDNVSLR